MDSLKSQATDLLKQYIKDSSAPADHARAGELLALILDDKVQEARLRMAVELGAPAALVGFLSTTYATALHQGKAMEGTPGTGAASTSGAMPAVVHAYTDICKDIKEMREEIRAIHSRQLRPVAVPASDCSSAEWERVAPQLGSVMNLTWACAAPCCQPDAEPIPVPAFTWVSSKEEDPRNIIAALQFLQDVLPPGITPVPVQGVKWLRGHFFLSSIELVITESKTDYMLVYTPAWQSLMQELKIQVVDHKVSDTVTLRDHLPRLLPYIFGFYEAKTPSNFSKTLAKTRSQAILEFMAAWHMLGQRAAPIVLFGDFLRTYCIHHGSGSSAHDRPEVHVAEPRLQVVSEGQAVLPGSSASQEVWSMARALLEQAKLRLPGTGLNSVAGELHQPGHMGLALVGGGWGGAVAGPSDRAPAPDADMDEAVLLHTQAQQMLAVMQHPEVYTSLGLEQPPTTYELGEEEDTWAAVSVLSLHGRVGDEQHVQKSHDASLTPDPESRA